MPQYQGVWTLEAQAQAQSNQQWVTDPNFKNTTLLLQADGTGSGSQNQTFLDGSTNNFFITRNGNTTQGSFSPFSQAPGNWSVYFDGNASCDLAVASSAQFAFGTSDFCIEAFVYQTVSANGRIINFGDGNFNFEIASGGYLSYYQGASYSSAAGVVPLNAWAHCVLTRQSGTMRIFVNGVLVYTNTNTTNKGTSTANIGSYPSGGDTLTGYISNLRVINGNVPAAYQTSSTTVGATIFFPPSSTLTAVSGTALLTCQSNYFVDNSGNSLAVTVGAGSPAVQAFAPFAPALQWTPDVVGGSGYFDTSGDYLTIASNAAFNLGSGDATIEAWIYPATSGQTSTVIDKRSVSTNYSQFPQISLESGVLKIYVSYTGSSWAAQITGPTITGNAWVHIAVVRSGNTWTLYVNGVSSGTPVTASGSVYASTSNLSIGAGTDGGNNTFLGYISNVRIIKGTAVVPPSGGPTAPVTAITNTQLLLNYTNAGIYDGTMNTSWETVGSTQVSTNPVKVGSGSIYFNGTASQRLLPSQLYPQLTPGTGDFTIECWLYVVGKGATAASAIIDYRPGVNGTYINWVVDFGGYGVGSTTAPKLMLYADSAVFITGDVISMGQWNHVALCRANGITRMFINGVLACTPTADTKNYASGGSAANYRPCIGATDGGDSLYGYIDDFRISRFARYIANFTPPQQALPRQ